MNVARNTPLVSHALPEISRRDRAYFVREARRLRAAELERLFRAAGRGFARVGQLLSAPLARRQLVRE